MSVQEQTQKEGRNMASLLQNDAQANYILSLADILSHDVERAGAKAAKLGELARAGFPVPDGFVLTTSAFDRFLAASALGPDSSPEAGVAATLPVNTIIQIHKVERCTASISSMSNTEMYQGKHFVDTFNEERFAYGHSVVHFDETNLSNRMVDFT